LYSVRAELAQDFDGVIRQIADMGYAGVETAGVYGESVEAGAKLFRDLGLHVPSAHVPLPVGDDKNRVLDITQALGAQYVVMAYIPPEELQTRDQIARHCQHINEGAANAQARGLTLCYHNHWWEFEPLEALGGKTPMALMLEQLDPAVALEIDAYWVRVGGADPAAVLRELGARVPLLHVKDGPANTSDPMLAVGDGVMDYPTILPAAANATWFVVELDRCATDMLDAVRQSYIYLSGRGLSRGR
jgi:sugar phosphate isomerase/epimerase